MDWVRLPKRLAIYYRDSFDCVWCRGVFPLDELGYGLTLDHVNPDRGHTPDNLVTCCGPCNSSKKALTLDEWYAKLVDQGVNTRRLKERIRRLTRKPLNMDAGWWLASIRRPKTHRKKP